MAKEIIINAEKEQTRIAIVENGELVELYYENPENERTIGDIWLGRVRKIMPSIQAAFVDIGQKQDAFLHFSDLADNLPELLLYLEEENPEVGKAKAAQIVAHKARPIRRHPNAHRANKGKGRSESQPGESEELVALEQPDMPDVTPLAEAEQDLPVPEVPEVQEESAPLTSEAVLPEAVQTDVPAAGMDLVEVTPEQDTEEKENAAPRVDAHERGRRRSAQRRPLGRTAESKALSQKERKEDRPVTATPPERKLPPEACLKRDQRILVKIVKEPISTKGSRVSTDISLAGRFLVLVPLADYVAVSKKIVSYKERRRLRALAKSLVPDGFGVIVRTVAEGKNAKALDTDLRLLVEKWRKIEKKLAGRPEPPVLVHEDVNMVSSVIRDLFSDDYDRILIDDQRVYRNIKSYIQAIAPHMVPAVQLHKGNKGIYDAVGIDRDVAKVFESRVDLPGGGYLFIERTEAMYVVDVNSGRSGKGLTQEENSVKVNLEAARVIAKQIRLRDLGGIIVIDFIDLRDDRNRQKVYDEIKKEFRKDRAVTKVLPMSDFGLIQITRQRLRPSITTWAGPQADAARAVAEPVQRPEPVVGKEPEKPGPQARQRRPFENAPTPEELLGEIEERLVALRDETGRRSVTLLVHPFTASYLNRKIPSQPTRWFVKHLIRVHVKGEPTIEPFSYRFVDGKTGEDIVRPLPAERQPEKPQQEKTQERPQGRPQQNRPKERQQGQQQGRPQERQRQQQQRPQGQQQERQQGRSQERPQGRPQGRPQERPQGRPQGHPQERPLERPQERPEGRQPRPQDTPQEPSQEPPQERQQRGERSSRQDRGRYQKRGQSE